MKKLKNDYAQTTAEIFRQKECRLRLKMGFKKIIIDREIKFADLGMLYRTIPPSVALEDFRNN